MNCMYRRSIYVGIDRLNTEWSWSCYADGVLALDRLWWKGEFVETQMQESMNSTQLWWESIVISLRLQSAKRVSAREWTWRAQLELSVSFAGEKLGISDVDSWPLRVPYQLAFFELRTCFLLMFAIQLGTGDSSQRNSCLQNTDQGLTFSFSHLFFSTISYSFIILLDGEKPATILKITVAMRGFRLRHVRRRRFIIYMACPT